MAYAPVAFGANRRERKPGALIARMRIHAGSYANQKALAEAAELAVMQQFDNRRFGAIYVASADAFKHSIARAQGIDAMNATFAMFGSIVQDVERATTCFPEQARMIRWLKTSSGNDVTAMVSPEVVRAHPCSGRVYVAPESR